MKTAFLFQFDYAFEDFRGIYTVDGFEHIRRI